MEIENPDWKQNAADALEKVARAIREKRVKKGGVSTPTSEHVFRMSADLEGMWMDGMFYSVEMIEELAAQLRAELRAESK